MQTVTRIFFVCLILLPSVAFSETERSRQAASTTTIALEAVIESAPEALYRMWTRSEGVATIFPGARAKIEGRVGGTYTVAFLPEDPTGRKNGTAGCVVLDLVPERRIVFQWRGPTWATEMNALPLRTWVEIDLVPLGDPPARTRLSLRHHGFGRGGSWERTEAFFADAWQRTLDRLVDRFATVPESLPSQQGTTADLWAFLLEPGPTWQTGKPARSQGRMLNHAAYLGGLAERGIMVVGGPFADSASTSKVIAFGALRAPNRDTAERYLRADPAVQAGTLTFEIRPWRANLPTTGSD